MPLVGAVAAPHSHLQLFTRPAESEQYKSDVQKGRNAMIALRAQVEGTIGRDDVARAWRAMGATCGPGEIGLRLD